MTTRGSRPKQYAYDLKFEFPVHLEDLTVICMAAVPPYARTRRKTMLRWECGDERSKSVRQQRTKQTVINLFITQRISNLCLRTEF